MAFRIPHSAFRISRRGFTLIELLVVMAMLGVVMGALLTSFLIGRKSYLSADAYVQVQQEARRAFDVMVKELREAGWRTDKAQPAWTGSQPPRTGTGSVTTAEPQLDLQVALGYDLGGTYTGWPAAGACPVADICWGVLNGAVNQPGWSLRYRIINGTQLIREVYDAGNAVQPNPRVLANDINAANTSFAYNATNKTVTILLAVTQTSQQLPGGSMSTTPAPLTTRVRLRN